MDARTKIVIKPPTLTDHQRRIFFDPARIVVCDGSTKSGKTVGALAWQLVQCWGDGAGKSHLWIASVYPQAKIAFDRMVRWMAKADPTKATWDDNKSDLCVTFSNGSRWFFKGSDNPDSIYGADYASVVIDEASRCKEEAWAAARSTTTATRGKIRIIGNVKGRKNWAYKLGAMAKQGTPGVAYYVRTAMDAIEDGVTSPDEVEEAKRVLPKHVFDELYLCQPSEDGSNPFGLAAIRACIHPLSILPPVCFGIDLAKSQDYTVVVGLDAAGHVAYFDRWHGLAWDTTESRIASVVRDAPALCDSSGVGDPIVERLKRTCPNLEGFATGTNRKQMLLEGLAVSIQQGKVGYPENSKDVPIQGELENYEWSLTRTGRVSYSAPPGLHDDCVIALALAALQFDKFEQSGHVDLAFLDLREERESRVWKDAGTEWEDRIL
jgi:hypothetical protein